MSVDIKKLTIFVTIAQEGSVTSAARRLEMTQPGLTVHLRKLEETLSLTLFERSKFRLGELTPQGRQLLPIAQRLLDQCAAVAEEIANLRARSHQSNQREGPLS